MSKRNPLTTTMSRVDGPARPLQSLSRRSPTPGLQVVAGPGPAVEAAVPVRPEVGSAEDLGKGRGKTGGKRPPGSAGGRPFISYVGVNADEKEPDLDGLDHTARMALEASAIECILEQEPDWQRTPTSNRGYDLFRAAADGKPARWCEVKAMTGGPQGPSRGPFPTHSSSAPASTATAYWL